MITTEIIEALKKAIEIIESKPKQKPKQPSKQERIINYEKLIR
jgi:hypothetical protein